MYSTVGSYDRSEIDRPAALGRGLEWTGSLARKCSRKALVVGGTAEGFSPQSVALIKDVISAFSALCVERFTMSSSLAR
ncbi:hypothetical protein Y032_0086g1919 [Ancylostoma ceylanicum]|uniref:Uncharacterized protein n=1 Tax=Ancylostoma ceylanicum TaxID=53326 RepID=A0A016TPL7_9BILA|nr:hypothetical protein Y032_0086g1919 [Ancylostoma ceylanicum]